MEIGKLFNLEKGLLQSSKCTPGEYDFITAAEDWKTHNEYSHEMEALIIAVAASGSLGRTHYVNGKFITSDLCFILTPKNPVDFPINLRFYHFIFNTLRSDIVNRTKAGTSKEAISQKNFNKYDLPYFPIEKQEEELERLKHIDNKRGELLTELTHQQTLFTRLRQSILQEAVQGQLTAQWRQANPNQEPASELLRRIQAEKAATGKKEKPLPPVKAEEMPFELPEGWVWCRLGDACISIVPNRDKPRSFTGQIPWITQSNFKEKSLLLDYSISEKGLSYDEVKKYNARVMPRNSVIMSCVGRFDLVAVNDLEIVANQQLHCFIPILGVSPHYLSFVIKALVYRQEENAISTTIKYLNKTKCESVELPLPPLTEQAAIVAQVERLLGLVGQLEAEAVGQRVQAEGLLQAALREAMG